MESDAFYLVIARRGHRAVVRRVAKRWPSLATGEAVVRLKLTLPDTMFVHPIHTYEVEMEDATICVEKGESDG